MNETELIDFVARVLSKGVLLWAMWFFGLLCGVTLTFIIWVIYGGREKIKTMRTVYHFYRDQRK